MTTWQVDTETGKWVGYQIISGFGTGMALALPQVAVQPGLAPQDISIAISMTIFLQFFGGALFVSVANNVLNNRLVGYVRDLHIPDFEAGKLVEAGATEFRKIVPEEYIPAVLVAYNEALRWTFRVGLIMACLSVLAAAGLEWKRMTPPVEKVEEEEATDGGGLPEVKLA